MTPANGARGIGLALEYMLNSAAAQPADISMQAARACIDAKTLLKNLVRGDLSSMDNRALLGRLEAIEAKLPARKALLPRPTTAQLVLILDVNEAFASPLRDEAPHPAQAHYVDRIFDADAVERLRDLDTAFSPLYVPLPAWNASGDVVDLMPYLRVGGLDFVAENVHPAAGTLGRSHSGDGPNWEQLSEWLAVNREAQSTWVMFQHVEPGADVNLPEEYRPYVVQRSAGRPFSDGDYEALEAALARRLVEVKTAEGRGVP